MDHIKERIEKEVLEKMEIGHLAMSERRMLMEDQIEQYMEPQIERIQGKVLQIAAYNKQLKEKTQRIMENQLDLESKMKRLEESMKTTPEMGTDQNMVAFH